MQNQNSSEMQKSSAFRKLSAQDTDMSSSDPQGLGVTNQMMQVINAQNLLIMKLLQRQNLLYQELNKKFSSSQSGAGSVDKQNKEMKVSGYRQFNNLEQLSSSSNQQISAYQRKNNVKILQRDLNYISSQKNQRKVKFQCEINCSPQQGADNSQQIQEKHNDKKKQTETKNMVKNFAKAIFGYIRKNRNKRVQVLQQLGIGQQNFMSLYEQYKGRIHSISQLRSLWIGEGNEYNKAFRILSNDYLRKHCLQRTFNSRVQNYSIHLKYRQRLLQGIKHPQQFTVLKTN